MRWRRRRASDVCGWGGSVHNPVHYHGIRFRQITAKLRPAEHRHGMCALAQACQVDRRRHWLFRVPRTRIELIAVKIHVVATDCKRRGSVAGRRRRRAAQRRPGGHALEYLDIGVNSCRVRPGLETHNGVGWADGQRVARRVRRQLTERNACERRRLVINDERCRVRCFAVVARVGCVISNTVFARRVDMERQRGDKRRIGQAVNDADGAYVIREEEHLRVRRDVVLAADLSDNAGEVQRCDWRVGIHRRRRVSYRVVVILQFDQVEDVQVIRARVCGQLQRRIEHEHFAIRGIIHRTASSGPQCEMRD